MNTFDFWVGSVGAIFSALAAALWLKSSLITVPNNLDTFIEELQRMGRWNSYAAGASVVAAICATCAFLRQIGIL